MTDDPFIKLPTTYGDFYIRRSQVVMLEPGFVRDGGPVCTIFFRLGDHTTNRVIPLSSREVMALLDDERKYEVGS